MTDNLGVHLEPPQSIAEGAGVRSLDQQDLHVPPASAPLRALIVDDATSTRRLLRAVLEHSPHFVVVGEAGDGDSAIELATSLQPDFVLLDLSMPLMDGASALSGLVNAAPEALVIIVSGTNPSACEELLNAGATAFIPKGIAPYELLMRLGTIVGRWVDTDSPIGWEEVDRGPENHGIKAKLLQTSSQRAVVYDDDPVLRQLITEALRECEVNVVAETDTALTLFTVVDLAQPEFVVIDVAVNGEPDTKILSEIRRRSPRTLVVVYSRLTEWKERVLVEGAVAFVPKPQIDELSERIAQLALSR
jgi:DNA-binding NarL/FixJ family response regulator